MAPKLEDLAGQLKEQAAAVKNGIEAITAARVSGSKPAQEEVDQHQKYQQEATAMMNTLDVMVELTASFGQEAHLVELVGGGQLEGMLLPQLAIMCKASRTVKAEPDEQSVVAARAAASEMEALEQKYGLYALTPGQAAPLLCRPQPASKQPGRACSQGAGGKLVLLGCARTLWGAA